MRELRRSVLTAAEGDVLELGAGADLNIDAYPPSIRSATLTEPEPPMVQRLRQLDDRRNVVTAAAESLPFADASFDTVVSTLVLCTVDDVPRTLNEVRRVLRPNDALLLIEHVRSSRPRLASAQDLLHKPWRAVDYDCNCNRDTPAALRRAGFDTTELLSAQWRRMPTIVRPLIAGTARPAASPGGCRPWDQVLACARAVAHTDGTSTGQPDRRAVRTCSCSAGTTSVANHGFLECQRKLRGDGCTIGNRLGRNCR